MTLRELINKPEIFKNEMINSERILDYKIVIEEYNERLDKWITIDLDETIVDMNNKQIILK